MRSETRFVVDVRQGERELIAVSRENRCRVFIRILFRLGRRFRVLQE